MKNLLRELLFPLIAVIAAFIIGGGVWVAIAGILKAGFGSHEVINTIMLNFVAVGVLSYLTQHHYKAVGDPIMQAVPIAGQGHIARFRSLLAPLGINFPQRVPL